MSASLQSDSHAEPNMTPILDMVFQLITFFMLVVNFKDAAMDQSLQLPILGSAQPVATAEGESLLVLNVDVEGHLKQYGGAQANPAAYIAQEARIVKQTRKNVKPDDLPTIVVIRADQRTPIENVNDIVTLCQKNGFRRFSFRTMSRQGDS